MEENNNEITITKHYPGLCMACYSNKPITNGIRKKIFKVSISGTKETTKNLLNINITLCRDHAQDLYEKLDEALSQPE